jgi:arylsulfatase A-like enzyme
MAANVDIAPTILRITGAKATKPIDGESLLPFARDPNRRLGRPILLEVLVSSPSLPSLYHAYTGVRTRRYLFVEYTDGERELYDLRRDPYELTNQASNPSYAAIESGLAALLTKLRHCRGESCRHP